MAFQCNTTLQQAKKLCHLRLLDFDGSYVNDRIFETQNFARQNFIRQYDALHNLNLRKTTKIYHSFTFYRYFQINTEISIYQVNLKKHKQVVNRIIFASNSLQILM